VRGRMDEAKKQERRKALAELAASRKVLDAVKSNAPESAADDDEDADDELDWDVDPADQAALSPGDSAAPEPSTDSLDSGWDDDEEEEEEEPEPELPDERLDPVAYAEAKAAQAERLQARKERKRAKDAAKKARQRARVEAAKNKQKSKSRKSRPAAQSRAPAPKKIKRSRSVAPVEGETAESSESIAPKKSSALAKETKSAGLSTTNKLILAIVVAGFIAAAIYAAYARR
jgi:cobalamin biosynthesis Mg chelatase CobN